MIGASLGLWTHALAALLFGTLALAQLRAGGSGLPRVTFIAALLATSLWALAVAGIDNLDVATRIAESIRNLAWLAFMYAIARRDRGNPDLHWIAGVYAAVALVVVATAGLAIASAMVDDPEATAAIAYTRSAFRTLSTVAALILVYRLRGAAAWRTRGGVRVATLALTLMWSADLVIYAAAWATGDWPVGLIDARGAVMVALAPLFGLAVQRDGEWQLQVSRTIALQSLSLLTIVLYVVVTGLATGLLASVGGSHARIVQTAFVFGTAAALLTVVSTPWIRAWVKVLISKHLFSHRYDYRNEWLRFTETLGTPGAGASPLDTRVVKAVADLTGSPGGALLVPDDAGLDAGPAWNWPDSPAPPAADKALFAHLAASHRILELDAVRAGRADRADAASIAPWLRDHADAWAVVPLIHFDRLAGAIVLARPPVDRALDWEDFDLLGVAGRQAASYIAEARTQAALADAQRFDEFNRRFAFIMHDLKNMVSQLTLVARNAERHADNPAFRADMVATLTETSNRMNALLARLSQHHGARGEPRRAVALLDLAERIANARRAQHPVTADGAPHVLANADCSALETLLSHLVQNAIEASGQEAAVALHVSAEDGRAVITVSDRGCGMSPAFVRDQLFKPFVSAKPGGFGLGAFEARQLAEAMGGTVTVTSREGEGTSFRVTLPLAAPETTAVGIAA
ncbi:XrtA/PEP-CTERM system histidine kinase PrsK [uncultured Sphingomonas sp.]|uniref:XrtA/PEP-CTERM system histidine kinase PrsK n=1 Tax=unclassified Sphingomonas TaxID=196159 RepID=UPI0025F86D8D|nr:XrtA/PEP-CTERM system histidine kinase PrsK [uncultured Sphingomonas sp.]